MSARTRLTAAAVALTSATLLGVAVLPASAFAATSAVARPVLTMTVGNPAPNGALMPGGAAETFTVTVTNNTGTVQKFASELGGGAHGAVALGSQDVAFGVAPLGRTPATGGYLGSQDAGVLGAFYPKGGQFGDSFTIPAHATYSWKLALSATKVWPINDSGLELGVNLVTPAGVKGSVLNFRVGTAHTGGPVTETLTGGGTVAPGHPAYETLAIANRTGAALATWDNYAGFEGVLSDNTVDQADLAVDAWIGGRWVNVTNGALPVLTRFANNATHDYALRVRLVSDTMKKASGKVGLSIMSGVGYPSAGTEKVLTVNRTA